MTFNSFVKSIPPTRRAAIALYAQGIPGASVGAANRWTENVSARRHAEHFSKDTPVVDSRPIYDVRSGQQSIEWARSLEAAHAAFGPAAYPCEIWKLEHGLRKLVAAKLPPAFGKVN